MKEAQFAFRCGSAREASGRRAAICPLHFITKLEYAAPMSNSRLVVTTGGDLF
jgi:hypothetical protein